MTRKQTLTVVLGSLLVMAAVAPLVSAQVTPGSSSAEPQGIRVLGEGLVIAQPDTARITLGVDVFNPALAAAQAEARATMDAVVQKLRAAGIPDTDIHTVSFNVSPQYDGRDGRPQLRGYQVQNLVEVKVKNLDSLGPLLDDVVSLGATRVFGIRFEAEDMGRLKDLARDQAMQNARAKAEQLARGAGVTLGRATYIEESDTGGVTPVRADEVRAAPAGLAAAPPTPIQPGELQVRTVVRVFWSIQ